MDRPGLPAAPPPSNVVAAGYTNSKVAYTLRESLYPAERETAAINLASQDLRAQPEAVQALLNAARHDPAGTVRAACVRCLARQQLNSEQVVNTFNDLKTDQDPRVRLEVEQALAQMRR
jgi:HEAT repeat protein